jgi:hypothetical protein
MYEERDLSHGEQMVECFKPFLRHLLSAGLSRKTLQLHRDNLWLLGGEIISDLHKEPRLRKRPTDQVVLAVLNDEGGPLIHGESEYLKTKPYCVTSLPHFRRIGNSGGRQARIILKRRRPWRPVIG